MVSQCKLFLGEGSESGSTLTSGITVPCLEGYIPTLTYGHDQWVVTERLWIQVAKISFVHMMYDGWSWHFLPVSTHWVLCSQHHFGSTTSAEQSWHLKQLRSFGFSHVRRVRFFLSSVCCSVFLHCWMWDFLFWETVFTYFLCFFIYLLSQHFSLLKDGNKNSIQFYLYCANDIKKLSHDT